MSFATSAKTRILVLSGWLLALGGGLLLLWGYEGAPGAASAAPAQWPSDVALERSAGQHALLVMLHPHCPCSRATVRELGRIMARCHGSALRTHVLLVRPPGAPAGWEQTDLGKDAAAIPGVSVTCDEGGKLAARFGAQTSGHAVLYDGAGRLAFQGGITPARGHEGDNSGSDAIAAMVLGGGAMDTGAVTTAVYGCPLCQKSATQPCAVQPERCKR